MIKNYYEKLFIQWNKEVPAEVWTEKEEFSFYKKGNNGLEVKSTKVPLLYYTIEMKNLDPEQVIENMHKDSTVDWVCVSFHRVYYPFKLKREIKKEFYKLKTLEKEYPYLVFYEFNDIDNYTYLFLWICFDNKSSLEERAGFKVPFLEKAELLTEMGYFKKIYYINEVKEATPLNFLENAYKNNLEILKNVHIYIIS